MHKKIIQFSGVVILVALANFSCSSSEEKIKENDVMADSLKYIKSIPPGSADIKAEIVSRSVRDDDLVCKIKIIEVTGYGPSISPLPPGIEIEAYISKSLNNIETEKIKTERVFSGRILQTRSPNGDYWEIINVK